MLQCCVQSPSGPTARAGWVLRTLLFNDSAGCILRDRKNAGGCTVVGRCASGSELVDWLLGLDPKVSSRKLATGMWQALLEERVLFHGKSLRPGT